MVPHLKFRLKARGRKFDLDILSAKERIVTDPEDRLKQAAADPSALTQEAIIDNLDAVERGRLSRIRNIGIAV